MAKQLGKQKWGEFISRLRQEDYKGVATELSHELGLCPEIDSLGLKAFLLSSIDECFQKKSKKAVTYGAIVNYEIILVALGLLKGYYGDMNGIDNASLAKTMELGERREKYLKTGPFLRTKKDTRYFSYDFINDDVERGNVKKSLGQQDGRLIKNKLAAYLTGIKDIQAYVEQSKRDYIEDGILKLPEQRCFLDDIPFPAKENNERDASPDEADEIDEPAASEENSEVSQLTVDEAPLAFGWGDSGGGECRPSYTFAQVKGGILGDTIVFNSISDSVIGNEKNFIGVREDDGKYAGDKNKWHSNHIAIENGKIYIVRLYVHNNNPNGIYAIAKNVRAAISLPYMAGKQIRVTGFIESSNAKPNTYWANVVFYSNEVAFHLEYIYGSAILKNSGLGRQSGIKVSDDIVTRVSSGGILVDYDTLDGSVPGFYQYASYIDIRVKAVFDTDYTLDKKVRLLGDTEWKESVEAKVGDKVEYRIEYVNTSNERHDNVMVKDSLPTNMRFVSGSTTVYNANHPKGTTFEGESIINEGLNLGNYNVKSNAIVTFTAEVVDKNLQCGSNTLINWVQAGINGHTPMQDFATVTLNKVCGSNASAK